MVQKVSASKLNMRHNWQQIENVRDNLNRTTLVKSVGKAAGQNAGTYKLRADSMNLGKLAPTLNEAFEAAHLAPNKHRQSYKQTQHLNLQDFQESSPLNNFNNSMQNPVHQGSVLNRRAGSQQWRNNSNFNHTKGLPPSSAQGKHDNSHHNVNVGMLVQSQSGKRGSSIQQQANKKGHHNRAISNLGDYISFDFNANETQPIHMPN